MAQRKKNQTVHERQKIEAARYRNEFFLKMKNIIDSCCGRDIYPLIPKKSLDNAYLSRNAPFRFKTGNDAVVPAEVFNDTRSYLSYAFKNKFVTLPGNFKITLNDYYTVYFTILVLSVQVAKISFPDDQKVKKALLFFQNQIQTDIDAEQLIYGLLFIHSIHWCGFPKVLYWFKHEAILPECFPGKTENIINIFSAVPENIMVKIDGIMRPAFRIGWPFKNPGPEWLSLKPSALGYNTPFSEMSLKVYVQSHALNRLLERVDCFQPGTIYFNMYLSLLTPKIEYDTNNNILVEFSIYSSKAGYFRVDVVNGIILVRTFLFITNSGTPEGQRLEQNTGLQKLDKKYLAIDKLSTFMTSDLDKSQEVMKVFRDSGCQSLINLYKELKPLVTKHADRFDSESMLNYFNYPKTDGIKIVEENEPVVNS